MIEILSKTFDYVIKGHFLTGYTTYEEAITNLYPLTNSLDIQRKTQKESFYKRLEQDLKDNCVMPPLTIAFIDGEHMGNYSLDNFKLYINNNIFKGFILDGIQRLSTLKRVYDRHELQLNNLIFLNIIICQSRDNLLYRMITLNNGQKPMTARHQIEILADSLYNFNDYGMKILTEKETENATPHKALKKADLISAYMAFLSNTTNLESSKIIESKMDELIAKQILDSDITKDDIEFAEVLKQIARLCEDEDVLGWFKNANNLIGFCVGVKKSIDTISTVDILAFRNALKTFEMTFKYFNVSKIKLSRERRKFAQHFIENYEMLSKFDSDELVINFNELL